MTDMEDQQGAQVPQEAGRADQAQPQYGQRVEPAYGARADQYPGWNPYVFGKPDPEPVKNDAQPAPGSDRQAGDGQAVPGYSRMAGQDNAGGGPRHVAGGIDLDDPAQNPSYGHWDPYAIIAFIMAIFFPVPILSAVLGGISIYRTRMLHMKGYGLALAAVIINVLYTLAWLWMITSGVSMDDITRQMLQSAVPSLPGDSGGTVGTGGGDGVSA